MSFASANRAHADSWVSFPTGVPHVAFDRAVRKPKSATSVCSWSIEISPVSPTVAADEGPFAQAGNSTATHRIASTRTGRGGEITGSS
jgi:hypothetical protein